MSRNRFVSSTERLVEKRPNPDRSGLIRIGGKCIYSGWSWKSLRHSNCSAHRESSVRWKSLGKPSTAEQLSSDTCQLQVSHRQALVKQLLAIQYLAHQGIALRGHSDIEGNLMQLLLYLYISTLLASDLTHFLE